MNAARALAFAAPRRIVPEATRRGATPSLTDTIAAEMRHDSEWAHPRNREIFRLTRGVRDALDDLACRLVDGRLVDGMGTCMRARLRSALARCGEALVMSRLTRLRELHSESGAHPIEEIPFSEWLDANSATAAQHLDEKPARAVFDDALATATSIP